MTLARGDRPHRVMGLYSGHDASVAFIEDDRILRVLSKERFVRMKGVGGELDALIDRGLRSLGWSIDEIDLVATSRGTLSPGRSGTLDPADEYSREGWVSEHTWIWRGATRPALSIDHHLCHAALSYYPSPFDEAAIMILDGGGDWGDATLFARGRGGAIEPISRPPVNLGLMWSIVAGSLKLPWLAGPGQLMALAAYGRPLFRQNIIDWGGGLFATLNPFAFAERDLGPLSQLVWSPYADHHALHLQTASGEKKGHPIFVLFSAREPFDQEAADAAASLQAVTEEVMLFLAEELQDAVGGSANLCLGGGVALNCQANDRLERHGPYEKIFVPPAVHDGGLALGAALHGLHLLEPGKRFRPQLDRTGWGLRHDRSVTAAMLRAEGIRFEEDVAPDRIAQRLAEHALVGFFEGGSEIGPRALGHRSILAVPNAENRRRLNEVKLRADYRPVSPSVPAGRAAEFFETLHPCLFMSRAVAVRPEQRGRLEGALHRDGTARIQAVPDDASLFRRLHDAVEAETGLPILLQTSFNRREPLVEMPADAIATARLMGLDALCLDGFWIERLSHCSP